jgi:circadian clock protein KaiB
LTEPAGIFIQLFVTGTSERSIRAVELVRGLIAEYSNGEARLEIVDVLEEPEIAEQHKILATPTLIRAAPGPERRIVGDLMEKERIAGLLGFR